MKRNTVINDIPIDRPFVQSLIMKMGTIGAMQFMQKSFTDDMNGSIDDQVLRVMVWQLTHSLNELEEAANMTFNHPEDINHFLDVTESKTQTTMARHIVNAIDSIETYVNS